MMKKLFTTEYIDVNKLLLDNYRSLNLNEVEVVFLMQLFSIHSSDKQYYSTSDWFKEIEQKTNINNEECMMIANKLINQGIIDIDFIGDCEVCNFSPLFDRIINDSLDDNTKIVKIMEQLLNRPLNSFEIQDLSDWLECGYTIEEIKAATDRAIKNGKSSFKYIQAILSGERIVVDEPIEIDKKREKAIRAFYDMVK